MAFSEFFAHLESCTWCQEHKNELCDAGRDALLYLTGSSSHKRLAEKSIKPTIAQIVREECHAYGVTLDDEDIEYVLWEETGYPCFWPDATKSPEENLRHQIREWAERNKQSRTLPVVPP